MDCGTGAENREWTRWAESALYRVAALAVMVGVAACGGELDSGGSASGRTARAGLDGTVGDQSPAPASESAASELRIANIAAVQGAAGDSYRVAPTPDGDGVAGANRAQRLRFELGERGLRVSPAGRLGQWSVEVSWTGWGRGESVVGMAMAEEGSRNAAASANRGSYRRGPGMEEWVLNGPLGIEQGFVLAEPPARGPQDTAEPLTLELQVMGARASAHPRGIGIHPSGGSATLLYTDLYANDDSGRRLQARMATDGATIRLYVDDAGAVYPVTIDPLIWVQDHKLVASDGFGGDAFGVSVAAAGDTAVVGAYGEDQQGDAAGAAYVFVRSGSAWTEQHKLTAADGANGDYLGWTVSVAGDTAVAGAPAADDGGTDAGAAYVFVRSGTAWSQQQKLLAEDGAAEDHFGETVAVDGDTVIVGAYGDDELGTSSGAAYIFARSGSVWTQTHKLLDPNGQGADWFGYFVALDGDTAVVSSPNDDGAGALFVYARNGANWVFEERVSAPDGGANDGLGISVALAGDTLVAGAWLDDDAAVEGGAAYVFTRSGVAWSLEQKLTASDGAASDYFGGAVAVAGDRAIIGAHGANGLGSDSGTAYAFTRTAEVWSQSQKLLPTGGGAGDWLGYHTVALAGDVALLGASRDDDVATDAGAAYVFALRQTDGEPCAQDDECANGYCVDQVCCNTSCGAGSTDDCQACSTAAGSTTDGVCENLSNDTECRASTGPCDPREMCSGAAFDCPADQLAEDGIGCDDGDSCTGGDFCSEGICVPGDTNLCIGGNGDPCTEAAECSSGYCVDGVCCSEAGCAPYTCGPAGACGETCDSAADCVAGYSCNSDRQCVPVSEEAGDDGCGCRQAGSGSPLHSPWLAAGGWLLLVMALARRRRPSRYLQTAPPAT